ncbi:MAG: phosphopyruvate hydratase [Candidatus Saccharibacteria bacterium]|nr:phosphopyruvate hydratase [Candidatus Saccharibacteria bacterium]
MKSISISKIVGRQILDSRGNPTVEADVILSNGAKGRAAVPSGASTGSHEAVELRDGGDSYGGKAVLQAVRNINEVIAPKLIGMNVYNQRQLDAAMQQLDGTPNKANLGANAILAVSLASAKAAAESLFLPLHDYIARLAGTTKQQSIPLPMMNVMNGGQHAAGSTDIQEFMIIPHGADTIQQAIEMGANVFHRLASVLKDAGYMTTVGDEGGYAPRVSHGNSEPLQHIMQAIAQAGYIAGTDMSLGLDVAATEFFNDGAYHLSTEHKTLSSQEMITWLEQLANSYPLISIEDGLAEDDWQAWATQTTQLGDRLQIVGDDLLVTNTTLLRRAINEHAGNAILIKPNQIGSLSETIDAVLMAKQANWNTVISHRSGETEDTTIAHIAVGLGAGQIKTGSLSRTDRVAKYNELLRIAEAAPHLQLARPFER